MNKLFGIIACFITLSVFSQSTFGPVEKRGFGQLQGGLGYNSSVLDMKEFKGKLYVGMGEDSGYVYRSATGDMGTFQKVYSDGASFQMKNFEVTNEAGGYMFAANYTDYGYYHHVRRTFDGVTWDDYLETYNAYDRVEAINAFKGVQTVDSIYVVIRNNMGFNLLLRNSVEQNDTYNSGLTWDTVASILTPFGAAGQVKASIVFNNKLYYAMDNNELYETADGRTLNLNPNYYNEMGYGSLSGVDRVMSMETFGGYLYFGTHTSFGGAQLWRTADGVTFDSLGVLPGGLPTIISMRSAGGKLFMVTRDFSGYYEIYSTVDGTTFVLEDNTELGDSNTEMTYYAPMEVFNNHLYIGTKHDMGGFRLVNPENTVLNTNSYGAQIYRTCLVGPMPSVVIAEGDTVTTCPGVSATLSASGAATYIWSNANTSAFLSTTTPGYYSVTGVNASGCRNSDGAYILNPIEPLVYFTKNNVVVYDDVICNGDTTLPITIHHPDADYPALAVIADTAGVVTPGNSQFVSDKSFTIEFWIKPTTGGTIISEYDAAAVPVWGYDNYEILLLTGTSLYADLPNAVLSNSYFGEITLGVWNHIAIRYDANTLTLNGIVNGVNTASYIGASNRSIPNDGGGLDAYKFMMPSINYSSAHGQIRDIRVWDEVRTDSQINDNRYGLPSGTYGTMVYQYPLNEGTGSVAIDYSPNLSNATVYGTFVTPPVFTWTINPTLIDLGNNTAQFFPSQQTTYQFSYIGNYGCIVPGELKVEPAFIQARGLPAASCGGNPASIDFISNVFLNGPTWSSNSLGVVQTYSVNVTPASDEWVYVSDNTTGCELSDSILVKVGPAFNTTVDSKGPSVSVCENTDFVIDAEPVGGTAPFSFYWNIDNLPTDTTNSSLYTFNVGTSNHYVDVYGIDAIGCTFQGAFFNIQGDIPSTDLTGHISTPPPTSLNVDNGFVYIFKHQPGNAGFDTVGYTPLDAAGNYAFTPLTAGEYLIKVMPDEVTFPASVPTYYGNAFQWDSSIVFTHGCDMPYTADIQIVEISGSVGTASISGYIIEEAGFGNNRYGVGNGNNNPFAPGGPLKGIDVKLGKNPGGGIQARTFTDSTGFYIFDSIPDGGYKIYVDIPNLPMDSTRELIIAEGDSSIQNNYYADSASVYINPETIGIYASEKQYENNFSIFPNPAKGTIYLNYELAEQEKVSFEIVNAMGQKVKVEQERNFPKGKNIFVLDLEALHLNGGVYFVSMIAKDKKYTQRIVVID